MLNKEEREFYDRHLRLNKFGEEGQSRLKEAKVLVVGAGGLGCPVLQYLTAAGVGLITIIDPDIVSVSNLQRQVLYTTEDIGKKKASVASEKLSLLNPFINIIPIVDLFGTSNGLKLVYDHDIVVDCTDNFRTRYMINDACVIAKKPFVYGAISQFSGQVSVFNHNGGPTYRCLFPEIPDPAKFPSCSEVGVVGVLPGMIGTLQANECIKVITGIGEPLSGILLLMDALTLTVSKLKIAPLEGNHSILEMSDYEFNCEVNEGEITHEELGELQEKEGVHLIDVRSSAEHQSQNLGGTHIALDELSERIHEIPLDIEVVVYCKSGMRSQKARLILIENGLDRVRSLKGGIDAVSSK